MKHRAAMKVPFGSIRDSRAAFDDALRAGRLSHDPDADNYAGNYMYMYTDRAGRDHFKHCLTREYLPQRVSS